MEASITMPTRPCSSGGETLIRFPNSSSLASIILSMSAKPPSGKSTLCFDNTLVKKNLLLGALMPVPIRNTARPLFRCRKQTEPASALSWMRVITHTTLRIFDTGSQFTIGPCEARTLRFFSNPAIQDGPRIQSKDIESLCISLPEVSKALKPCGEGTCCTLRVPTRKSTDPLSWIPFPRIKLSLSAQKRVQWSTGFILCKPGLAHVQGMM